jgi:hypothetical protein
MRTSPATQLLAAVVAFLFTPAASLHNDSQVIRRDGFKYDTPSGSINITRDHNSGVDDAHANDCAQVQQKISYSDSIVTDQMNALRVVSVGLLGQISTFFDFATCAVCVGNRGSGL